MIAGEWATLRQQGFFPGFSDSCAGKLLIMDKLQWIVNPKSAVGKLPGYKFKEFN